ncbi:MAG: hypothetical protein NZ805_16400, partial [Armatimonadetes bacterium]|nr:hypothetical protein [Armatimonadota bacterium]
MQSNVCEENREAIDFLLKRGFEEVKRFWELKLDVAQFEMKKFLPIVEQRKIATAIKIAAIGYAQKNGFRYIVTHNTSDSMTMLPLKEKLGFKR